MRCSAYEGCQAAVRRPTVFLRFFQIGQPAQRSVSAAESGATAVGSRCARTVRSRAWAPLRGLLLFQCFSFPGLSLACLLRPQGARFPCRVRCGPGHQLLFEHRRRARSPARGRAQVVVPDLGKPLGMERAPSNRGCLEGTSCSAGQRSSLRPNHTALEIPFRRVGWKVEG
jgi:hypothetical protein